MQAPRYSTDDSGEPEVVPCSGESAPIIKIEVDADGTKKWYRVDGPTVEYATATRHRDDKLHRKDGPAIERANGYKAWCTTPCATARGPAGSKMWLLRGMKVTEHGHTRARRHYLSHSPQYARHSATASQKEVRAVGYRRSYGNTSRGGSLLSVRERSVVRGVRRMLFLNRGVNSINSAGAAL